MLEAQTNSGIVRFRCPGQENGEQRRPPSRYVTTGYSRRLEELDVCSAPCYGCMIMGVGLVKYRLTTASRLGEQPPIDLQVLHTC